MANSFKFGALYGSYDLISEGMFHDARGRFNQLSGAIGRVNMVLAERLQEDVAAALRDSLRRPAVSTGMLERVVLDRRNRQAGYRGFGVGLPAFLNESAAKYWEQIEEGSTVHLGQRMTGLWADSITYNGPEYITGRQTSQRSLRGTLYGMGQGTKQGFRPFTRKQLTKALKKQGWKPGTKMNARGTIKRPIEEHRYFEHGWERFGGLRTVQQAYDEVFRSLGLQVVWSDGTALPGGNRRAIGP